MKIKHLLIGMLAMAAAVACKQDELVETPELDVDKAAVELSATAGEASFNVTSNQSWVAQADADWVSLEPASGAASEKAVAVKVTAEDNETAEARTATVTVKAGELSKTVKVTQAANTGEEPGPGDELEKSEWALVGTFGESNNWNPASDLYLSVLDEEYFVYYGIELASDTEFKFLKGGAWPPAGQEVGGNGLVEPNTIQPAGGSNIKVTEAGKYDIYLAADLTKFYIMSEGKLPSEATEPAPVENQWGMMGCFVDNQWSSDVPMTKEGEWIVAKGAQFTELTFKIRANSSWADATNIGVAPGSERGVVNGKIEVVTAEYSKANLGGDAADIKLNGEAGTYDVYFSFENLEVYVMEAGFKPGEKEPQNPEPVEVTYTVTGTIKGTDADKKANYWNPSNEPGLMALEGDYYVAKNVEFDYDYRFSDDGLGEDFVKFKICETGTWNAYGQAEEAINKPNTEIAVQMDGADIYLNKSGVYDVYFDKTNGKVWVMEAGYKPGEEIARLDGYQWMGEFDDMPILFDLGVAEEGMLSIALPTMDESGFALHMVGFYEIEATDKSSGVILFTQYDWEWDEMGEEFEIQYSELTANSVKFVCENVFGVAEPVAFTRVENPYEIQLPGGGGESPEGPIADGGYWFTNSGKVMAPMAEDVTSGVFPAKDLINYASTVKNTFTFTYDPDMSYYTIQDSYGRFLGNESWGEDISLTTVLPTGEDYAYYLWCVDDSYDDGTVDIYNAATYNGFAYSSANNNWYLDPASYETDGIRPFLVAADNPVEEPVEPEGPKVVTVAEFLAAAESADVWYELTGTITNISNTTYGNFDIQDETGSIYVYGLTATKVEKNDKSFSTLGLEVGDVVTLIGTRASYNGSAQVGGPAYYVSHVKGEEPEIPVGSNVAEITFSTMGYTNAQVVDGETISIDDNVNVVFRQGGASTAPAYYDSGAAIRMYQNGATMDITAAGKTITSIEITFANNHYYVAADSGELSAESSVRTWTGSAEAVKFTSTGTDKNHRAYVSAIKVIYE